MRYVLAALAVAALAAAPAYAQSGGSQESAEELVAQATEICAAAVFDGQSLATQLEGRPEWRSVPPSRAGSSLATHAWQHSAENDTFVMLLPNGGCSFGVDHGDSEALRARIEAALAPRAVFEQVMQQPTRNGRATRYGYCVREDHPRVMSIVAGQPDSDPNLVVNIFRASSRMPEFCVFD